VTKKRQPHHVPQRPVPEPGEWGRVVVDTLGDLDLRVGAAIVRVEESIQALMEATEYEPNGICWIKHPREARHDAVGFLRRTGSERIIHRYAGLSKLNPPIDPFRPKGEVDAAIRCEQNIESGKPNTNPIRCAVTHGGNFGTTEVAIQTGSGVTPFAPWQEASGERALTLLRTARSALIALRDDGPGTDDFQADALCQAVNLMDAMGDLVPTSRMGVDVVAESPISRPVLRPNWSRTTFDPQTAGVAPLTIPGAVAISLWTHGDETRISLHPAARGMRFVEIDAMARLRATARISERGYRRDR
jgi:hypothetical protein